MPHRAPNPDLPITPLLPRLLDALSRRNTVLLQAAPGAGKTTRVPPALLDAEWRGDGKILMLEPRRLAARSAARFMARALGEPVGETVGYRVRLDSRVSTRTRIEVVTEGVLTRMIQSDPALSDYAVVVFDEFHERSLQADLGLALTRESQQALREDLRILVMSATLDVEPLADLLDGAPILRSAGRAHPVRIEYRPGRGRSPTMRDLTALVCRSVRQALDEEPGSLLVFLPGIGEIRRAAEQLEQDLPDTVRLAPLYGDLSPSEQDAAVAPAPEGLRKVVLATAIAESSLTIDGIRVVIDAGLQRRSAFDPNSGMSRLVTERVSRASAEQRAGRAGRLEPGVCYRLWPESERLEPFSPPEILHADLAPLVLELARWGARSPDSMRWLNPPPRAHWAQARDLLQWLDAVDEDGALTRHGEQLLDIGLHPRLAHLILSGRKRGWSTTAAELAAILSERDLLTDRPGCDLSLRLQALRNGRRYGIHRGRKAQVKALAESLSKGPDRHRNSPPPIGDLLALAYPDRIAQARGGRGRFRLSNGRGALLFDDDALAGSDYLVAAELDGRARESRIFLAAETTLGAIESVLAHHITTVTAVDWDDERGAVVASRQRRLGALVLDEEAITDLDPDVLQQGLLAAIRRRGLDALNWSDSVRQWRARAELAHRLDPEHWPAFDETTLLDSLDDWLAPFLTDHRRWQDLSRIDWLAALKSRLDYSRQQDLDRRFPQRLELPTGQQARLDYTAEPGPVLATKLQTLFGQTDTPTVGRQRHPVLIHLLSPAGRPLAVTSDLKSFWINAYP
ncbi:MAG: ATP-dependent helicase HrpB, partial [Gammaproteobacteria bacterium]|nr:ATP-dependent helicase HrpB [Gammaproteobacteria bacterium]